MMYQVNSFHRKTQFIQLPILVSYTHKKKLHAYISAIYDLPIIPLIPLNPHYPYNVHESQ